MDMMVTVFEYGYDWWDVHGGLQHIPQQPLHA